MLYLIIGIIIGFFIGVREPGFCVGLINYPRFPSTAEKIREHAIAMARRLLVEFRQFKVSIVFPDETVMVEEEDGQVI